MIAYRPIHRLYPTLREYVRTLASMSITVLGFVYTQTTDRPWRKNRQTVSGSSCVGRDPNRNWPYEWELTGGASTDPCAETFKGRMVLSG